MNEINNNKMDIDENENAVDYGKNEENINSENNSINEQLKNNGLMNRLLKNMTKAGNKKNIIKNIDKNSAKNKQKNINNLINELAQDNGDEENSDIDINIIEKDNNKIIENIPQFKGNNNDEDNDMNNNIISSNSKKNLSRLHSSSTKNSKKTSQNLIYSNPITPIKRSPLEQIRSRTTISHKLTNTGNTNNLINTPKIVEPQPKDFSNNNNKTEFISQKFIQNHPNNPNSILNTSTNSSTSPSLPTQKDGSIIIYWYDAIEESINRRPSVIIFGKIYEPHLETYSSISIVIKNIDRTIFVLPKPEFENDMVKVFHEFDILRKNRFSFIKNYKCKEVVKKYCFELPIDHDVEHKLLKITYKAEYGALPNYLNGRTFEYIFGKYASLLENIMLSIKLKGPSWLKIKNFTYETGIKNTWSKFEVIIDDYHNIEVLNKDNNKDNYNINNIPPFRIMSLSMKTIPVKNEDEIFCIAISLKDEYYIEDEKGNNNINQYRPIIFMRIINDKLPIYKERKNIPYTNIYIN